MNSKIEKAISELREALFVSEPLSAGEEWQVKQELKQILSYLEYNCNRSFCIPVTTTAVSGV